MESLLPDSVKAILLVVLAIGFGLSWLARRRPDVAWLQAFRLPVIQRSPEEEARRRRSGNRMAALELMLTGLGLPLLYVLSTVMMFNNFHTLPTIVVGACSAALIALGVRLFVRNL